MENLRAYIRAFINDSETKLYQRELASQAFTVVERHLDELEQQLKNCNLQSANGSALLNDLLNAQQEIINSPIRFNGVSNEDIKRIFAKHGIDYKQPF